MQKMTRRAALAAIPAMGAAAAVPAMAQSPHDRLEAAVAELKAAMLALDPSIQRFDHDYRGAEPADEHQCRFYLVAYNWSNTKG